MTEHGENNIPVPESEITVPAPGILLREKREAAGLSYQSVAESLHLTVHYIKALENDDYSKLPGLTFVKGYIRSYARLLNMDQVPVLECYEQFLTTRGLTGSASEFASRHRSKSDQAMIWAFVAGFILIIALVAGWWFIGRDAESAQTGTTIITSPTNVTQMPRPASVITQQIASASTNAATTAENTVIPAGNSVAGEVADGIETIVSDLSASAAILSGTADSTETANAELTVPRVEPVATQTLDIAQDITSATDEELSVNKSEQSEVLESAQAVSATGLQYQAGDNGKRLISLLGNGSDTLEMNLNGNSWAEIEDAEKVNLFNDMLREGDMLSIKGTAPFYVLLGDARSVQLRFNTQTIEIDALIRSDNTARFVLSDTGLSGSTSND